jgi:hypothetical protein
MVLIPLATKESKKLKELVVNGYVYPLDEALGLNRLPAKLSESYE